MILSVVRHLFVAVVLTTAAFVFPVQAAGTHTTGELIDIAGSQRMLPQRMLRDYALVGMGITYQDPAADLDKSVRRFSQQLELLKSSYINDEVVAAFVSVETLWTPIRKMVTARPAREQALTLRNDLEQLLKASHNAVLLLQKAAGEHQAEVVNIAGRQRMLSQRMAALYMLYFWNVEHADFYAEFLNVVDEFRKAQNFLFKVKINTPAIRKQLTQTAKSFRWFEKAARSRSSRLTPEVIMRHSDIILKAMNEATGMYAAQ